MFRTVILADDMDKDLLYIRRCLELAKLGEGSVAPNPMVGAVVVCNDKIIGEGFHEKFGGSHAEVNAIDSVEDKSLLKQSTLYVNLEPCSHTGKTPPCSNLVVKSEIPKIVVAMKDPNPKVSGNGIEYLKKAGCNVEIGILEEEALFLNRFFVKFHVNKRPYVVLKWAETKDRYVDKNRKAGDHGVNWITSGQTQILVHQWRNEIPSILVGENTVINDNPSLTVRQAGGQSPLRLIISKDGGIPSGSKVLDGSVPTIVYSQKSEKNKNDLQWVDLDFSKEVIPQILDDLYQRQINAVMIEGGKNTIERFIESGLWDEARVLIGNTYFGDGLEAPKIKGIIPSHEDFIGKDELRVYMNKI